MPRHGSVPSDGDPLVTGMPLNIGPAHAVYFATYEAVKQLMGGNKAGTHHPLAAGTSPFPSKKSMNVHAHIAASSHERRLCDDCQRRADEPL